MEAESESVDISSLKVALLQPLRSLPESRELDRHLPPKTIETISTAFTRTWSQRSHLRPHHSQAQPDNSTQRQESLPELDSIVPESAEIYRVKSAQPTQLQHEDRSIRIPKAMTASASPVEATQELSQSIYQGILQRSHVTSKNLDEEAVVEEDETPHTLREGDEGHVDFGSGGSLLDQMAENDRDSEDEMLLPTQTQNRLSKFPDSQRFKTPATAGKKRRYDGSAVDSPEILRRPWLRPAAKTPGNAMGLSQAFAATQAVSSPPVGDPGILLPSDRPSPEIEMQNRPMTATTSSPIMLTSEFRRAATEPASHYISVTQSQDRRNHTPSEDGNMGRENAIHDDFDAESSIIRRHNAERERYLRSRKQLELASSPSKKRQVIDVEARSSPIRERPDWGRTGLLDGPVKSAVGVDAEILSPDPPESEAETEEERTSPINPSHPVYNISSTEEDKENVEGQTIQVPQTALRLQRIIDEMHDIHASPLLRHTTLLDHAISGQNPSSPQHFAVANSQASRTRSRRINAPPTSSGGLDFVPQSQNPPLWDSPISPGRITEDVEATTTAARSMPISQNPLQSDHSSLAQDGTIDPISIGSSQNRSPSSTTPKSHRKRNTNSTIYETRIESQSSKGKTKNVSEAGGRPDSELISGSETHFESARSTVQTNLKTVSILELSSPPIATTPPGLKRQRMSEMVAEPSSIRSSLGFDAMAVLQVDSNSQNSAFSPLSSPATRSGIRSGEYDEQLVVTANTDKSSSQSTENQNQRYITSPNSPVSSPNSTPTPLSEKQDTQKQAPIALLPPLRSGSRSSTSRADAAEPQKISTRASLWELDASPPQRAFPTPRLARKAVRTSSKAAATSTQVRKPPRDGTDVVDENKIVADPTRSSPSAVSIKSDVLGQGTRADSDEIIAPNMVFACYNGKARAYYPAKCLGYVDAEEQRFKIQWDGYEPDEIDEYGIRSLDLRVGDAVKVDLNGLPRVTYIVRGMKDKINSNQAGQILTDLHGYQTLVVAAKQRKSLPANVSTEKLHDVPMASIYLDSNMWNQMKNRIYHYISPAHQNGCTTPLERPSTPSTPCSRSRRIANGVLPGSTAPAVVTGVFRNMIFAISYEDANRKNDLARLIRDNGGQMVEGSFTDLLESDRITPKTSFQDTGFTALLASRHSRKEKYMQALALNIPCLGGKWIEACIKERAVVDWKTYLLPAGESIELEGATRSRVMANAIATDLRLDTMLETRSLMLRDASVVVVIGKGKAEIKRKPYLFLIQALGAARIEKVSDLKAAKSLLENDSDLSWCFVDDKDVENAKAALLKKGRGQKSGKSVCKVAGNETIVQSLILGRLCEC